MDAASFGRVYNNFQDFHSFFAASFGRKQWREHSRNYLRALLVQAQERRNAGNLSESVGISARAMQRFLTEARWSDDTMTGRLQKYLAPRLEHPEAVWVLDGSDFPKQGRRSAGVARQYCGRLGKAANCAFGAVERLRMPMPEGGIGHAEVEIGGAALMLSDALPPRVPAHQHPHPPLRRRLRPGPGRRRHLRRRARRPVLRRPPRPHHRPQRQPLVHLHPHRRRNPRPGSLSAWRRWGRGRRAKQK